MNFKPITLFAFLILGGCQTFASTNGAVSDDFQKSQTYPSLKNFGDEGGELIIAVYDRDALPARLRIPKADIVTETKNEPAKNLRLGSFVTRSGILDQRTNPLLEIGALYYFPNRFNLDADRNGKVIQKVCETVDSHNVDEAIIRDEPSGIVSDRRKFELDGKIDAKLIRSLSGISASADANYLFELQIIESRLRSINSNDGRLVRQRLLAGNKCSNQFIPDVGENSVYQLTSAYYGSIRVKQIFEIKAGVGTPILDAELGVKEENGRDTFLFFKVFLDEVKN